MKRTLQSYAHIKPSAIANGSPAQTLYFVTDAQLDILALASIVTRVSELNPDAGEIGPGMLVQLVTDAKRILNVK